MKKDKGKVYINIRGGLGNQLFQYASSRAFALENDKELVLDISGITNEGHNIFALDKFNIEAKKTNNIKLFQKTFAKKLNALSYRIGKRFGYAKSYKFDLFTSKLTNIFGVYSIDNGYTKLLKSITKNDYLTGYFQSEKYFSKYEREIKQELKLKDKLSRENQNISNKMKKENSICVHIRRGDFVQIGAIVCSTNYYLNAIEYIKNKIKNPVFYIFSNDINWVKENIKFKDKVVYMDKNNSSYEELVLMSSCNNFIISNSTFSWWAQYLSNNNDKIVIAPDKWFLDGQKEDIYSNNWIIMNNDKIVKGQH